MQITYSHPYGSQENYDLNYTKLYMTCEQHEERDALENGWLIYNGAWYQCRSTRLKLFESEISKPIDADFKVNYIYNNKSSKEFTDNLRLEIFIIWQEYLQRKGYVANYDIFTDLERSQWITVRDRKDGGKLVGFTKMQHYYNDMPLVESQYNAYTINGLGNYMLKLERRLAAQSGYLYTGPGYERSSIYKAHLDGFEWWTGSSWSSNKNEYIALCKRDSEIKTLKDLAQIVGQ